MLLWRHAKHQTEVRNAESRLMSKELLAAFRMADEAPAIKVIILAGAVPSFSGGHDLGSAEALAEEKSSSVRQLNTGANMTASRHTS